MSDHETQSEGSLYSRYHKDSLTAKDVLINILGSKAFFIGLLMGNLSFA